MKCRILWKINLSSSYETPRSARWWSTRTIVLEALAAEEQAAQDIEITRNTIARKKAFIEAQEAETKLLRTEVETLRARRADCETVRLEYALSIDRIVESVRLGNSLTSTSTRKPSAASGDSGDDEF